MRFRNISKGALSLSENLNIELVAAILILFGAIVSVISAFGMLRLPDVYTRSHAATKSATLSVLTCLLGAFIYFWVHDGYVSIRLILGIIFVFITAPVAGHLVCRAAYRSRVPLAKGSVDDELEPLLFGEKADPSCTIVEKDLAVERMERSES